MKTILNVVLAASGSPNEVKERITDQVKANIGAAADQAQVASGVRQFIDKALDGVSEDETVSAKAEISIVVADVPAIVNARVTAAQEAADTKVRALTAERDAKERQLNERIAELDRQVAALTPKTE